jgi:N-acetylneuraminic acid mutarotase
VSVPRLSTVLPLVLALLASCDSPPPPTPSSTGTVRLAASTPTAAPGDVARVTVTVSGPGMTSRSTNLVLTDGAWGGVFGDIPAGTGRTFLAQAFNASNVARYEGRADNVTVTAGATGLVSLTLLDTSAPPPFTNEAPVVDALLAQPTSVEPGGSVTLTSTVHDPNAGDSVSYAWSAPSGTFSAPSQANTTWTAPSTQGPVTLSLKVSDSRGASLTASLTVSVLAGGTGTSTGSWSTTGRLVSARYRHATAALPGGKVLVAGGYLSSTRLASAEVYDPATGTWSTTGAMTTARVVLTLTPLADGRVLATGGYDADILASAEVYDPATGTWSPTGDMPHPHMEHTATLLPNGKVLVTGGYSAYLTTATATAELYDPATGTWSSTSSMSRIHEAHTATLLPNGKVLVVGGSGAELYNPVTGTWSAAGTPSAQVEDHTATLLSNGKVLVAGGFGSLSTRASDVYDPATNTWSSTGDMTRARHFHTATLMPDGRVLVTGGNTTTSTSSNEVQATAELYDPATGTWSPTASMSNARRIHGAVLLGSGQVLVMAGYGSADYLATAELYTPAPSP